MNAYNSYKASGVEWLGDVPSHWEVVRFGHIFAENKRKNTGLLETNVLSLSYGNIKEKNLDESKGLLPESFETYQIIESNDIIFRFTDLQNDKRSLRSAISKFYGIISSAYVSVKTEQNADFYNYLFRAYDLKKVFYAMGDGMRQSLKIDELNRMPIVLPNIEEQTKIVNYLEQETAKIDRLITKQNELITLLEEQKKAVISHAVTKGLNPNTPMKASGVEWLGDVPSHWELKQIKKISFINQNVLSEDTSPDLMIEYIDIGSVSFENGIEKTEKFYFRDAPSRARRVVQKNDIIVSTVRTYLKAVAYIDFPSENLIVSTGFAVFSPIIESIQPKFAKYSFLSESFISEVIAKSKGVSYPAITATELNNIKLPIPSLSEQNEIVEYLDKKTGKIDRLIAKQNKLIDKLAEYRTSLIAHAVTGKIDVRGE